MSQNAFRDLDESIADFVQLGENRRLMGGTGAHSTLFRGPLFGSTDGAEVTRLLLHRRVDVLLMGSNPNVPSSLEAIKAADNREGHFAKFKAQMLLGRYGQSEEGEEGIGVGWSPDSAGKSWKKYMDALRGLPGVSEDGIAMANYLPWGSKDYRGFFTEMAFDTALVGRMQRFADDLHVRVCNLLRPRLIVVPLSLGRAAGVGSLVSLLQRDNTLEQGKEDFGGTRAASYYHFGQRTSPGPGCAIAFVPHPSSLKFQKAHLERLMTRMQRDIGAEMAKHGV